MAVTIISHFWNMAKARKAWTMKWEHITNTIRLTKKTIAASKCGSSLGSACGHTAEKLPFSRTFPIKNTEQNWKLSPSKVRNMHSIHTSVGLNINQRKTHKIYDKTRKTTFHVGSLRKYNNRHNTTFQIQETELNSNYLELWFPNFVF